MLIENICIKNTSSQTEIFSYFEKEYPRIRSIFSRETRVLRYKSISFRYEWKFKCQKSVSISGYFI